MQLTEQGELVAEHAKRVMEDQDSLIEELNRIRGIGQTRVTICCGEGFVADLIENGLRETAKIYPDVRFLVDLAGTDHIVQSLADGDADIGLAYNPVIDNRVRSVAIARQPLCAIVPPAHPLLKLSKVPLCRALAEPHALLPLGHGVRQLVGRVAADNYTAVTPRIETSSIDLLRRFVTCGFGITFLPPFAVSSELKRNTVATIELLEPLLTEATVHILVRAHRRLPLSVSHLVNNLAQNMFAFRVPTQPSVRL